MKHTAVEQLQVNLSISLGRDIMRMLFNEFEQAKEIEKEQIYKALIQGNKDCNAFTTTNKCEEYYNENYKNTEQ